METKPDAMEAAQAELARKRAENAPTAARAFDAAFLAMQKELPTVPKSRQGYGYKYAPYEEIARHAFPVMWKHGFYIWHGIATPAESGEIPVLTELVYTPTGEKKCSIYRFRPPVSKDGGKTDNQELGKALTYGKRYNTVLLLGLSIEGEPDIDDAPTQGATGAATAKANKAAAVREEDF